MPDRDSRVPAVERLSAEEANDCAELIAAAFERDATLRFVVGEETDHAAGAAFAARLRALVDFFVAARVLRREPMLGVRDGGQLVAAALVSCGWRDSPSELGARRTALWNELGAPARERYERIGRAFEGAAIDRSHLHLNMLGVRGSHRRRGLGARLVAAVQEVSRATAASHGVALVAEGEANARFYEGLGFGEVDVAEVAPGLVIRLFFREDEATDAPPEG